MLALYLVDGSVDRIIEFEFDDDGWLADVAAWNHHKVGISLACGILAMDDILVSCPYLGNGEHASQGVFIVVGEDAGVFVMSYVNGACNGLLVA